MKKLIAAAILLSSVFTSARAGGMDFHYNTSADVVSCYIWRGLYNGGLSFQPDLSIGWESDHASIDLGTWWNVGASDWMFRKNLVKTEDYNPNTYLTKELDLYISANLWGAIIGITHYYYFDGESFFNFGNINDINGTAQTELTLGYDFSSLIPLDLHLTWNTMISGDDGMTGDRRCFSTYIEASYCHQLKNDFALTGVVGISPWKSIYTDIYLDGKARNFAVNNISLRLDKMWSFAKGSCELTAFIQGTMNTCNLGRDNAFIHASGDDKLNMQKLMGAIGVNFSFGGPARED